MADFPDSTLLSKLHQALSRRSLMREMAAAGILAVVPAATVAAPVPVPVPSPRIRMNALINELFAVAREFNPDIGRWSIRISEPGDGDNGRCSVLIAAFNAPELTGQKVEIDWRQV
jgi:hypothetical protein